MIRTISVQLEGRCPLIVLPRCWTSVKRCLKHLLKCSADSQKANHSRTGHPSDRSSLAEVRCVGAQSMHKETNKIT